MTPLPSPFHTLPRTVGCLLVVATLAASLGACGGTSADQQRLQDAQTAHAIAAAKREARTQERIRQAHKDAARVRRELAKAKRQTAAGTSTAATGTAATADVTSTSAVTSSGGRSCGEGVTANSVTSCPFALRVKAAYTNQGGPTVDVYSPVTQRTYVMTCSPSAGAQVTCRGGNNAVVSF
jgi:hypothetical protein